MRAIILAAGRGERMRPLTDVMPKPLIKVAGKALIEYHLEKLAAVGVTQVIINHAWLGQLLVDYLGDGSRWQLEILYSAEHPVALGTAGGIANALPLLGNEPFWVINGDIWTDFDFSLLPKKLDHPVLAHLLLTDNPAHNINGDFGLAGTMVTLSGDKTYTYSGIGLYHPLLFNTLEIKPTPLGGLLRQIIAKDQVTGQPLMAQWTDVGTGQRLALLEQQLR